MGKQSSYATRQREKLNEYMRIAERITRQFDVDTFQVALNRYEKLSLGYQRIMEITELWEQVRREYSTALIKDPEADVAQHHLDAELLSIAKDEALIRPFPKRYPELRQANYEGKVRTNEGGT